MQSFRLFTLTFVLGHLVIFFDRNIGPTQVTVFIRKGKVYMLVMLRSSFFAIQCSINDFMLRRAFPLLILHLAAE